MGLKHQTGKQRKDKFYHLAKETGFRARSAFKLIQLNRKFEFLQKSRVVLDLCAAPGSWMQVARQNMPHSAICVGVDIAPIKPIPNCIALREDITTDKCRQALKRELQTWKADVVLNDGAPNVGTSWLHDSFKQAELTLSALALATDFLRKGGWFVTKVFRSKDYHALIWVFKMFFNKVHATKPQASRNVSAEIFVVCQGYKAPDKIDPKFLNSKYVFGELNEEKPTQIVLGGPLKKEKAVGYADGDGTVYNVLNASEFISNSNHLEMLQAATKIVLDTEVIANHPATTDEIRANFEDIKVLGKAEIKAVLKWRKKLKEQLEKKEEVEEEPEVKEPKDEEEDELAKIDQQIAELKAQQHTEAKKKRKKLFMERRKILEKLKVSGYSTEGRVEQSEQDLFALRDVKDPSKAVDADVNDIPMDEEVAEDDDAPKVRSFDRDDMSRDAMGNFDPNLSERLDEDDLQWVDEDDDGPDGLGLDAKGDGGSDVDEEEDEEEPQLLVDDIELAKGKKASNLERRARKAELWFDKDVFESIEDEADEDFELEQALKSHEAKGGTLFSNQKEKPEETAQESEPASKKKSKSADKVTKSKFDSDSEGDDAEDSDDDDAKSESSSDDDDDDEAPRSKGRKRAMAAAAAISGTPAPKKRQVKLDPAGLTLGSMLIHSKKARRDIVDASYNRYAFDDVNLPAWFVDDEKRHMRWFPELDPALLAEYKERAKEVDVRPIKKVAEAKARKKRRLQKRMEKAKKRAEGVMDREDSSTMEKARELKRIYARARSKKQEEIKYVVAKKSTQSGKRAIRPAGVKGRYKVVDPRMKKDLRAMKGNKGGKDGGRAGSSGRGGGKGRGGGGGGRGRGGKR